MARAGRARSLEDFAALISPAAEAHLEALCTQSQRLTQKHFGKVIRLFAPLYLSNECINICKYCGFSRDNPIPRLTLTVDQVESESQLLAARGFRSLLLVAGEHPKFVSNGYVADCIERLLPVFPSIALELGPLETSDYVPMVAAGCEGLVVYQETYHEPTYRGLHTAGPKKDYWWRMDTAERGYAAGFRRLGIGALFGLHDWRAEAIATAAHARHLLRQCWRAQINISLPRIRPAAGGFAPRGLMTDRQLALLIAAFRLYLPHVGIVLSTREAPRLRDGLIPIGITTMSAGSSTEPGGYANFDETTFTPTQAQRGEQFHIADERPPEVVAAVIRRRGYEPVWKDFDQALVTDEPADEFALNR
ncbi:MAG: thiamine biosynthesis protein ThiH [Verrucomicrobia bacterium RIFCSPLOWO2_12_FULL_64_8]|nr:MAG: thiamine biosynthesis protein ThiH [Verrucomicrobia bacterium RIFCSPLOWO2_12_FULL_64_8]